MSTSPEHELWCGRFRIERQIGMGATGVVYLAWDSVRATPVALKTLTGTGPESQYRLKREFRILSKLEHPNLLTMYELFAEEGRFFFSMEHIEGPSVVEWVRQGAGSMDTGPDSKRTFSHAPMGDVSYDPRFLARVRSAMIQILSALQRLHSTSRVHRDVKPANILVDEAGRAVLIDFGLVQGPEQEGDSFTGILVGTPQYMAPEQCRGERLSGKADTYAVGTILFEMLYGARPFEGNTDHIIARKRGGGLVVFPNGYEVPPDLFDLMVGLLQPAEADRLDANGALALLGTTLDKSGMVPREAELATLEKMALETSSVTLLMGEAGVGKTHVLRRLLRRLIGQLTILEASGRMSEAVPFQTLDSLVDGLSNLILRKYHQGELDALVRGDVYMAARLFPGLRRIEALGKREMSREPGIRAMRRRALDAVIELFRRVSRDHQLLVVIDALQWVDPESRRVLPALLRACPNVRILLVGRPDVGTSSVLGELQVGMRSVNELRIGPLDDDTVRKVLGNRLPQLDAPRIEELTRQIHGRPFVLARLLEAGAIGPVPPLSQLLSDIIETLIPAVRTTALYLAVAGRPLTVRTLAALDVDDAALRTDTRILVWNGRSGSRTLVSLRNEAYGDLLVDQLSEAEVSELHRALARVFEAGAERNPYLVTYHYRKAGRRAQAARYAGEAAQEALDGLAFERAEDLFRFALEEGAEDERALRLGLAAALGARGDVRGSAEQLLVASTCAPDQVTWTRDRAQACEVLLGAGYLDAGLQELDVLFKGVDLKVPSSPVGILVSALLARLRVRLRGLSATQRHDATPEELSKVDLCWTIAGSMGHLDGVRALYFQTRHLLFALAAGEPRRLLRALTAESLYRSSQAREMRGISVIDVRVDELMLSHGRSEDMALIQMSRGYRDFLNGEFDTAEVSLSRAIGAFRGGVGLHWERAFAESHQLFCWLYQGRLDELARALPKARQAALDGADLGTAVKLVLGAGYLLPLRSDQPDRAHAMVAAEVKRMGPVLPLSLAVLELSAKVCLDLYGGERRTSHAEVMAQVKRLGPTMGFRFVGDLVRWCLVASLQMERAEGRGGVMDDWRIRHHCNKILGGGIPWLQGLAELQLAALEVASGRSDGARTHAMSAMGRFERSHTPLLHAVARHRYGTILGGERGASLTREALRTLGDGGISKPLRWARMRSPWVS